MKQVLITVLAVTVGCPTVISQAQDKKSDGSRKAEQQVMELNRVWAEAITKGDAATLGRLFADDIIVTSGSGVIRNKAVEIEDAAGGAHDPDFIWTQPFTTSDVRVRVYQDAAVVTGLARWAFKYKSPEVNQERRYTHLYVKEGGQWRIVAQQISANLFKKP